MAAHRRVGATTPAYPCRSIRRALAAAGRLSSASLVLCGTLACSPDDGLPPAHRLPAVAVPVRDFAPIPYPADLDGDGRDEILQAFVPSGARPGQRASILIQTHEGTRIDQLNFVGFLHPPHLVDLEGDDVPEILVPVTRGDTLSVTVADAAGRKLFAFPIATGKARRDPDGELPWDPQIKALLVHDVSGDGHPELVSVVNTGFAREPRGVFIHSLPDGRPLDTLLMGAGITRVASTVLPGASAPTLLLAAAGVNNGARAGGFDDRTSYVIAVDLVPELRLRWWRDLGGVGSWPWIQVADMERDGQDELVIVASDEHGSRVELASPATGRTRRARDYSQLSHPVVVDLDEDQELEIVAAEARAVVVLDPRLDLEQRVPQPSGVWALDLWPDVDGDGRGDLLYTDLSARRKVLLGPDLRAVAHFPLARGPLQVLRRGSDRPPLLVGRIDGAHRAVEISANRWYLAYRYGPVVAAAGAPLALVLILGAWMRTYRRGRLRDALMSAQLEADDATVLAFDAAGRLLWCAGFPGDPGSRGSPGLEGPTSLEDVEAASPELGEFCRGLLRSAVVSPVDARLRIGSPGGWPRRRVTARPVRLGVRGGLHWIVRAGCDPAVSDPAVAHSWSLVARRVAHDFKNPLAGILLTLDRMRAEVRDHDTEAADALESYANRIEERIGQLRRMSSNFLKLVDLDESEREVVDLSAVTRRAMIAVSQTVPDDIDIRIRSDGHEIPVRLDREQYGSVLENVVANAVNAMPDGGGLVVRTDQVRAPGPDGEGPEDWGILEVRDTGVGMAADVRARVFEAGFTTEPDGTGLGLAIVRKIVEDHGGQVTVESEEGVGSVVTVHLPCASPDPSAAPVG